MSYDLIIIPRARSEDWPAALERMERLTGSSHPLTKRRRSQWEAVRAPLEVLGFETSTGDNHFEFNSMEPAIQVMCFEHEAGVSIPYGFEGEDSSAVMEAVSEVISLITQSSGWSVYDPQLDRGIDSVADLVPDSPFAMSATARHIDETIGGSSPPWWRFWER